MTAPRPHRFTALLEVGDTETPFTSSARWRRHQCCSSAIRARALSTIWILSGFDKGNSPVRYITRALALVVWSFFAPSNHVASWSASQCDFGRPSWSSSGERTRLPGWLLRPKLARSSLPSLLCVRSSCVGTIVSCVSSMVLKTASANLTAAG